MCIRIPDLNPVTIAIVCMTVHHVFKFSFPSRSVLSIVKDHDWLVFLLCSLVTSLAIVSSVLSVTYRNWRDVPQPFSLQIHTSR